MNLNLSQYNRPYRLLLSDSIDAAHVFVYGSYLGVVTLNLLAAIDDPVRALDMMYDKKYHRAATF